MEIRSSEPTVLPARSPESDTGYRVSHFDSAIHSDKTIAQTHLIVRQWQEDVQGVRFSNFNESWEELNAITTSYLRPGGNFFVAEDPVASKVMGFVGMRNGGDNTATLKRMAVLPEYHRHGVGASLVMMALAWTRSQDFSKVSLTTGEIEDAKPFYERFGFQEIGRVLRNRDYVMELVLHETDR